MSRPGEESKEGEEAGEELATEVLIAHTEEEVESTNVAVALEVTAAAGAGVVRGDDKEQDSETEDEDVGSGGGPNGGNAAGVEPGASTTPKPGAADLQTCWVVLGGVLAS